MFELATVKKRIQLASITRPSGGGTSTPVNLPRTGFAAKLILNITGTIAGTLSAPNALGMACLINRIRLTAQGGVDLFNMSGPGYFHLFCPHLGLGLLNGVVSASPYAAVSATTYDLSMVIPIQLNDRDHSGLVALQNDQTLLTLSIDWLADGSVATGVTSISGTVIPVLEFFTVPTKQEDWPRLDVLHSILEDQLVVSGAGDVSVEWPRGDTYLRVLHGAGINQSPADSWSAAVVRINESDVLEQWVPNTMNVEWWDKHRVARRLGVIAIDRMASGGLGDFGSLRDAIDTRRLASIKTVITATGAITLYTVRETLVKIA